VSSNCCVDPDHPCHHSGEWNYCEQGHDWNMCLEEDLS